jgi:hypothetical protein
MVVQSDFTRKHCSHGMPVRVREQATFRCLHCAQAWEERFLGVESSEDDRSDNRDAVDMVHPL